MQELTNAAAIWYVLRDVPPQRIIKEKSYSIQLQRDKVGLLNVPVTIKGASINMIFDTGANFSVMQRSIANSLGLPIIHSGAYVNSITGTSVRSDFAVMDKLNMGGLELQNVVFLITDDTDLTYPQINYAISGIIGYPVIRALEEFHLDKREVLYIPFRTENYTLRNLAIDNLTPIVKAEHNAQPLIFHFDLGATNTEMYRLFYEENKVEVERKFRIRTFNVGGAGGVASMQGYQINSFKLKIGNASASLNQLKLSTVDVKQGDEYYHGNLGLDYVRKFNKMKVNFKKASILFE